MRDIDYAIAAAHSRLVSTRIDVDTSLGSISVYGSGTGDPVMLWPSLLVDHTLWDKQVDALAGRYQVLAVDPPGHGSSSPVARSFTLDECAECVCTILDTLGLERTHFVGNSWGAMVGGVLAARHAHRIGAAILLNGTASPAGRVQRLKYSALLAVARVLGGIKPPLDRAVVNAFLGPTSRRTRPDAVRTVLDTSARVDISSAAHCVRSIVPDRPDNVALFGRISTPVLVVAGREDEVFPIPEVERMAAAIPTSRLVVVEDAAHLVALEIPSRINELVGDFLAAHPFDP